MLLVSCSKKAEITTAESLTEQIAKSSEFAQIKSLNNSYTQTLSESPILQNRNKSVYKEILAMPDGQEKNEKMALALGFKDYNEFDLLLARYNNLAVQIVDKYDGAEKA